MDIKKVEQFVTEELTDNLDSGFTFHTLDRARDLVSFTLNMLDKKGTKPIGTSPWQPHGSSI